jgi:hypothetical protein
MTHAEFVQGLRNAADFFEARPELGLPYEGFCYPEIRFGYYGAFGGRKDTPEFQSPDGALYFAKHVGGRLDKKVADDSFELIAKREGFSVKGYFQRDAVCTRVQVGVKQEPEHVLPARPAEEERIIPAQEVPIYEWRCPTLTAPRKPKKEVEPEEA